MNGAGCEIELKSDVIDNDEETKTNGYLGMKTRSHQIYDKQGTPVYVKLLSKDTSTKVAKKSTGCLKNSFPSQPREGQVAKYPR